MKARLFDKEHGTIAIQCPGCGNEHYLNVNLKNGRPCWGFDYNYASPTFTPSLLVRTGKFAGTKEWYDKLTPERRSFVDQHSNICHSFIRNGKIQFLGDCTHSLKNQTVDLPDYPLKP